MRVLILAPGSWGDVSPALRIAADLMADGHAVTMVVHADYAAAVESSGASAERFDGDLTPVGHAEGLAVGDSRPHIRDYLAHLREYMSDHAEAALRAAEDGAFDAVLTNPISPYGHDIAEALRIPSAEALLQPAEPSGAYPPMIASAMDFGPLFNLSVGRLARRIPAPYEPAVAMVRERLGLPVKSAVKSRRERARAGVPVYHGISTVVFPRPRDWPAHLRLDGFWWPVEDAEWTAPPELTDFLADGPAPVLVSMGSIPAGGRASRALAQFASSTRRRVLFQGSAAPTKTSPDRVLAIGQVPHSWLLPKVATVIHQAGAGVTAACWRAGIPGIALPQHTDQFFWARTAARLDTAPPALTGRRVALDCLHSGVEEAIGSQRLRRSASRVAAALGRDEEQRGTDALRQWIGELVERNDRRSR